MREAAAGAHRREGWAALAARRGWSDASLAHARGAGDATYGDETVIELPGDISMKVPAYPSECDYVRVVDRSVRGGAELAYWTSSEWRDAPAEVMGALMGLLKQYQPNLALELACLRDAPVAYERTADENQMALYIAEITEGEFIADPEVARSLVKERYPREVWVLDAQRGDSDLGYWEWALHQAESALDVERVTAAPRQA
ncbi:hypothetical protein [Ramlibacter sp. AN1133]|uniref:hypothetical protein n=1 Tax=Ramlibacter sp. AN1133 TaxID=3133429 RepID=UPI0030C36F38